MARVRIRWKALGKGVALAALGLLGLQLLPSLLKPPEPPPLAADVGLPRIAIERQPVAAAPELNEARARPRKNRQPQRRPEPRTNREPRPITPSPASPSPPPAPPQSAPILEQSPAPAPEPAPVSAPPPAPEPAPTDGSLEFAPR